MVDGPLPEGLPTPIIGGSVSALTDAIAKYRAIGLDELIVPDGLLGQGADRLRAMDTVLGIVRG